MTLGLFDLPFEIRFIIYEFALPYSVDIKYEERCGGTIPNQSQVATFEKEEWSVRWFPGAAPTIITTNRQVYEEASEILYQRNVFELYVRHPRRPRLSMNDGHVDPESFVLISRATAHWCNPKWAKKIYMPDVIHHSGLAKVRRWHVNLPSFQELLGCDFYIRQSSDVAFAGIEKWAKERTLRDGALIPPEVDRLRYIQNYKHPIDEVASFLRSLSRIERLCLSFKLGRHRDHIFCLEYLVEEFYGIPTETDILCFCNFLKFWRLLPDQAAIHPTSQTIDQIERELKTQSPGAIGGAEAKLNADANAMLRMIRIIRRRQLLGGETRLIPA